MPHYIYICKQCQKETELFHRMSESPDVICKDCNEKMNIKITGGSGFIFKGSGFPGNDMKKLDQAQKESSTPRKDRGKHEAAEKIYYDKVKEKNEKEKRK